MKLLEGLFCFLSHAEFVTVMVDVGMLDTLVEMSAKYAVTNYVHSSTGQTLCDGQEDKSHKLVVCLLSKITEGLPSFK